MCHLRDSKLRFFSVTLSSYFSLEASSVCFDHNVGIQIFFHLIGVASFMCLQIYIRSTKHYVITLILRCYAAFLHQLVIVRTVSTNVAVEIVDDVNMYVSNTVLITHSTASMCD